MKFVVTYTFAQDNKENQNTFLYQLNKQALNKNIKIDHIDLRHYPKVVHVKFSYPGPIVILDEVPAMGYKNVTTRIFEYMSD